MDCTTTQLSYAQTGAFSKIVLDYVSQSPQLRPFFEFEPSLEGIKKAVEARSKVVVDRAALVQHLKDQYRGIELTIAVGQNIDSLLSPGTFTVTTAHQNNIFTGPLYFLYKIIHAIRLAERLNIEMPSQHFVPVYYMGSEDADLEELNHIHLGGTKLVWQTNQRGAVGRMKVDKELLKLIDAIEGQLAVLPHGAEVVSMLRESYQAGDSIQSATLRIVNKLFASYGLVVLVPDSPTLKKSMQTIFEDDLLNQSASSIVSQATSRLAEHYKVQAHPREINLFYLHNDLRERIEQRGGDYVVVNTNIVFSHEEILRELSDHPERFSPNVILRGLYQETILPNVVFIGGGGELAYWLELYDLFKHYKTPYPVMMLRNSFLVMDQRWKQKADKLGFSIPEIFLPEADLLNLLVRRDSDKKVELNGTLSATEEMYEAIKKQAGSIDATLTKHVDSLKTVTLHKLRELEKKMLRAEKRKFSDQQRQIHALKENLFPASGLQERIDSMLSYYATWGGGFIRALYTSSPSIENAFVVLSVSG
jgi:bacillithiol biosynthesis cysteine-adding enzyme BshC